MDFVGVLYEDIMVAPGLDVEAIVIMLVMLLAASNAFLF